GPLYDYTAYTQCESSPRQPLYNGGILQNSTQRVPSSMIRYGNNAFYPSIVFHNLRNGTFYTFSSWVKISGADSALIRASITPGNSTYFCVGTVIAKSNCWSFLKGGFVFDAPPNSTVLDLQNTDGRDFNITMASTSLQPFTDDQWRANQELQINKQRKRAITIHVADAQGNRLQGASVTVKQISKDFPFGSAIAYTIIGNSPYQKWFLERFNAAVFENELKWYVTEPVQGQVNYNLADELLKFIRANRILTRGHNIFWEDPKFIPSWVQNLTGSQLQSAVNNRIQSLLSQSREEFIQWDVNNEMLHFNFYEQRLGPNASLGFYQTAQKSDPLATLVMNEYNVIETCYDNNASIDLYISRLEQLESDGVSMNGIGLEGHFTVPNPPLIRAVLDKLSTLGLPIWFTEVDISNKFNNATQAVYLEKVLREVFSHPAVDGIMLWTALHQNGCYQMCLTDNNFRNLPAGDVVDKLLKEWQTGEMKNTTDNHGSYTFFGFLGEYTVNVQYQNRSAKSTFYLCSGDETEHFTINV
ncbi:Glycoside hydrolase family 10 domain, partial [Dillenia turbinata]